MSTTSAIQISPNHLYDNLSIDINALIAIFGLFGNLVNIFVFINHRLFRGNQCIFYLIVDSIVNIGGNLVAILSWILLVIFNITSYENSLPWCKLKSMLIHCLGLTSILVMCFASCDQFFSTSPIYYLREKSTLKLAYCLTLISACCAIIIGIPILIYYTIDPWEGCVVENSRFLFYYSFIHIPLLFGILPIFVSSVLSILAFRNVRRIIRQRILVVRRRLDQQLTAMILMRVIFFVMTTFPYIIYRIYVLRATNLIDKSSRSDTTQIIGIVCYAFVAVNASGSFYLFLIFSSRYRHQIKYVLVKKFWRRLRRRLSVRRGQVTPVSTTLPTVFSIELETVACGNFQ